MGHPRLSVFMGPSYEQKSQDLDRVLSALKMVQPSSKHPNFKQLHA